MADHERKSTSGGGDLNRGSVGNHLTLKLGNQLTPKVGNVLTPELGNQLALLPFRLGIGGGP
jgi:hypothetical protein